MTAIRWDPFTVLARLDDDFDELVRRTWGTPGSRSTAGYVPAVDMTTDGSDVLISVELPGVDVERDLDIEVHEGRLTISGSRQEAHARLGEGSKILVREMRSGSFRREFALPDGVTADDISADYAHGLLTVRVSRVAKPVEAPRKIAIRSANQTSIEGSVVPDEEEQDS